MSDTLEELTKGLPPCPHAEGIGKNQFAFDVTEGELIAFPLIHPCMEHDGSSALLCKAKAGTTFPKHAHAELEVMIVTSGEMRLKYILSGLVVTVGQGQHVQLDPGSKHMATFPVATEFIAVTIPKSGDYPEASSCKEE